MSDKVGKVFKVVGIAALGIATWGVGTLIAGGATIASAIGGGVAFGTAFSVSFSTLASIGILGLSIGAVPRFTQGQTGANQRGTAAADPNAVGDFVVGETTVFCKLVFEQLHSSEDEVTNVFSHAWHEIESYVSLSVDGELVSFSGDNATGDYAGVLTWRRKLGAPSQTALSIQTDTDWETTATFEGVAHSSMTWDFKNQDKLTGGVPIRLDVVVQGAHLYDPREDNAYGSGSQDFDDPTTWTYEPGNPALAMLRFIIGERTSGGDLIWGRGALESEIDMASFVAMADVADEDVGGTPRYQVQFCHSLDGSFENFVRQWEHETGGKLYKSGGVYSIWLPHDDLTAVTTITENDLLNSVPVGHTVASDINSFYNCARGRFIDPAQGYKGFPYPEVTEDPEIVVDGGKRVMPLEFSWVQDVDIAQRIAHIKIRRSRFQRLWSVSMGWKGQGPNYAPFTVHNLNVKETGYQDQLCRVIDRRRSYNGATVLVLQQEDVSLYDDTIPLNDPLTNNEIPTTSRIDRLGTLTPRFVDGTAIIGSEGVTIGAIGANKPIENINVTGFDSSVILGGVAGDVFVYGAAVGQFVTLRCGLGAGFDILGTSDDTSFEINGIEPNIRPVKSQFIHCFAIDDGNLVEAMVEVQTDGDMIFSKKTGVGTYSATGWTNSGNKGLPNEFSINYKLD